MIARLARDSVERWLSPGRQAVYLRAADGDRDLALELYAWNSALSTACMQDLGHLEVLMRNRYDAGLAAQFGDWTDPESVLWQRQMGLESARRRQAILNRVSRSQLKDAAERASRQTRGHVVANLSFGFWTALTRSEREAAIWTPCLSRTFGATSRGPVHDRMVKLNVFRNRLAHWEPTFSRTTGLARQLKRVDELFVLVDADVAKWVGARSPVVALLGEAPVPVLRDLPRGGYLGRPLGGGRIERERPRGGVFAGNELLADLVDASMDGLGA